RRRPGARPSRPPPGGRCVACSGSSQGSWACGRPYGGGGTGALRRESTRFSARSTLGKTSFAVVVPGPGPGRPGPAGAYPAVVVGLDAGADDYVTKPFRLAALLARVRAHLRRAGPTGTTERLAVGRLELDTGSHRIWVDGQEVDLRPREFDLLALLMSEAGRVDGPE